MVRTASLRAICPCTLVVVVLCAGRPALAQVSEPADARQASVSALPSVGSPSVGSLFSGSVSDLLRMPSRDNLTVLTIGAFAGTLTRWMDSGATSTMSASPGLGRMLSPGELIGGARMQMSAALATYAAGRIAGSGRVATVGADLVRAQIVSQLMTSSIKLSARRGRPDGTQYSFPSGHTSSAFATATVLQRDLGWKAGVPAYALATYIAASRIQVKRHFLSDVTFGAAVGIVAGRAVTVGRGGRRFAVTPFAAPSGGGVSFTLVNR